jgi:PAS domain S-box-containing protein
MNWIIVLSIGLRLLGVGYSILLLARTRDRRFGFLTLLLSFMTLRQLLTVQTANTGFEELPGLIVSALTLLTVYYLSAYIDEENAIKTQLQMVNERLRSFQKAIEHAGHAVYITDRDGTIEYVNPAFESITGYSANEAVGRNPRILQSGEMPDDFYEDLWSTLLKGNVWEEELVNQRKNDELYFVHQTISPIKADDEIDGFVAIQTDISNRKKLEADLKTSLTQLNVMSRVLRHNLRNDMTVIKGNAETIQATSDGDVAEMAEIIIEESEHLLTTAEKEREITEVLVDEQSPEPINLGAVIDAAVAATREQYPEAHITVEGAADRQVRAMESINRALTELLTNAVNHSDQTEPSIEVIVENRDDAVVVRIADDGPGIPEMERKIITEEAEIDSLYHGTGLGLWLVKVIVEDSGGSLAFDENEPRGSIVTIILPMAPVGGTD